MNLSIVIPCYNEELRIQSVLSDLQDFVKIWEDDWEVIFVDDGSEKELKSYLEEDVSLKSLDWKVIRLAENSGKGFALKEGVNEAKYDYILTIDADGSYHPSQVKSWIEQSGKIPDNEIWLGSRMHNDSTMVWENEKNRKNKSTRKWMGLGYNIYVKTITNIDVYDTQSGFKLYPKSLALYLFNHLKNYGWAHDVSLLYKANLNEINIVEQPVHCLHKEGSKIQLVQDTFKMFFQTMKISFQEKWQYFVKTPLQAMMGKNIEEHNPYLDEKKHRREVIFRGLFVFWSLFLLVFLPLISKHFAIAGDEWIQNEYGKEIFNYFAYGDPRAYQEVGRIQNYDAIVYYSGGFEWLLVSITKLFPNSFEYDIRHFLVALTGAILFIYTGLLGRRLGGWTVGFLSLLFISLNPRMFGEAMNNSKDIPFALGVVFTLYHMIPFLKKLPHPSWRSVFWITAGLAFTYNIRIGAFIVVGYLGLFSMVALARLWMKEGNLFKNYKGGTWGGLTLKFATILIMSYFLGIITWPWAMQNPLFNPMDSMKQMANFPITLRILFDGMTYNTALIPKTYIPIWMGITNPEIILILLGIGTIASYWIIKHFKENWSWILHFTLWFPIVFAIMQRSVLYDGWRHFLFLFPSIAIIAAMAFVWISSLLKSKALKYAWAGVLVIGMALPVKAMFDLHPYEYVYFNHAYGGLEKAFGNFETDYYFTSAKEAVYTLAEKEDFYNLTDSVYIRSNMVKEVREYAQRISPYIVVDYSKFETRHESPYDFAIYNSRFLDKIYLDAGTWPPINTMYFAVEREGVPLSIVLKNVSEDDYLGFQALEDEDQMLALQHFQKYLSIDPDHEGVLYAAGIGAMIIQQYELSASYLKASVDLYPNDATIINLALTNLHLDRAEEAIQVMDKYVNRIKSSRDYFAEEYEKDPSSLAAINLLKMEENVLKGYYQMYVEAYKMLGNEEKARYYYNEFLKL